MSEHGIEIVTPPLDGPDLNRRMGFVDHYGNPIPGHRSHNGAWFGQIKEFPAVLWDGPYYELDGLYYGYIWFETENDLKKYRDHGLTMHPCREITAPKGKGISTMPGYRRVSGTDLAVGDDGPTGQRRR